MGSIIMRKKRLGVLAFLALGAAACAVGTEGETTVDEGGTGRPAGDGGRDSGITQYGGDAGSFDSGAGEDVAVEDAATDADDGGGAVNCAFTNGCQGARDIGVVSGDQGNANNARTTTGTTSEWLMIKVTEDVGGFGGHKLRLKVSLASPPGSNFDLFLYVDSGGSSSSRACTNISGSSTNPAGQTDEVTIDWGEGSVANGSDDTRIVSIEVRNVSGTCSPSAEWTVVATGAP